MSSPSSLSHEIAAVLRSEILGGQYRTGERLPSERDLSARFDSSRGAVREALSQLEQLGIINILPGGARVLPVGSASLSVLGALLTLDAVPNIRLVDQFLEIFGVLAALTARNALRQATSEEVIQLQGLLVNLSRHSTDFATMQPCWRELLDYLARIDDNLVVQLIGNDLKAQFVEQMLKLGLKPRLKSTSGVELVKSLEKAFRKKDGEMAAAAITLHFGHLRNAVRDTLNASNAQYLKKAV